MISAFHFYKLFFRLSLFVTVLVFYIAGKISNTSDVMGGLEDKPVILAVIWIVFFVEMVFRFFPSKFESMGCQKQFPRNYKPTGKPSPGRKISLSTFFVLLFWLALNSIVGIVYYIGWIDRGILILISLFYSVCDMICILFFCPFQTWFMKNKCCGSCRIYNWDYAMMFTPLVFIPNPFTWSIFGVSLVLTAVWETALFMHPERFTEETNACLSCSECREKLCQHKRQLRHFLKKNKARLLLKGNQIMEKAKKKFSDKGASKKGGASKTAQTGSKSEHEMQSVDSENQQSNS